MSKEKAFTMDVGQNNFVKRQEAFEKELGEIQDKYNISLYAANSVLPNQEVIPVVKMLDRSSIGGNDKNENKAK